MIQLQNLVGGYNNSPILKGINLEIQKGEFFALLGPNGSGKTTLFKLITGQLAISDGQIHIDDRELSSLSKLEKAKKMAVLTQEVQVSFDYTVEEIVSLGRYPHQKGLFKQLTKEDRNVIEEVMELTKTKDFRDKQFRTISGGEKQRVLLAKALAQEPELLLLDEPTNHLDIKHTFQLLDLLKERQQTKGMTIFAILHDLNVASLYADRLALLHNGTLLEVGTVDILRKEDQLKKVYEVQVTAQSHPTVPKPQLLMTPKYTQSSKLVEFENSFTINQHTDCLHVQFEKPLRTISNGILGEGIQWINHFCNFQVDKNYHNLSPQSDIKMQLAKYSIPFEQTAAMLTAVNIMDAVIATKEIDGIQMMVVVTAEVGEAVDITHHTASKVPQTVGTINTMLFIDGHFSDGALVNSYMCATEAKVKALQDLQVKDPYSNTIATGTPTDTLLVALTQKGEQLTSVGSGTAVGRCIGEIVYGATKEAIAKYLQQS